MAVLLFKNGLAQLPSTSVWLTAQVPVSISVKWQWYNDATYKTMGLALTGYQRFYRTGIRYQFSEKWSAIGGVAFFSTRAKADIHDSEFGREFRIWQELSYQKKLENKFSIQHRLRTEERFLQATTVKSSYRILNINNRLSVQKSVSEKWNIQVADEYFEQLIDRKLKFNQNRMSASGTYIVNKTMQLQGTYMWLLRKATSQHVMQFTVRKTIILYGRHEHS
jgi:hypothetical protein